ncbi:hypothetical protein MGSAQ_001246 [marine sediment metagenome]|uniref:Uncharacterized protein n=1 Tax=marine sediment metagenome TaxID=412755 RepID=A0A1B6NV70_9ZZZZ
MRIAARVMRIICARTTRVRTATGRAMELSFSPSDMLSLIIATDGNQRSLTAIRYIRT